MASNAYMGTEDVTFVAPPGASAPASDSAMQKSATQGVIGFGAIATATRPFQKIGSAAAPVAGAFVQWNEVTPQ